MASRSAGRAFAESRSHRSSAINRDCRTSGPTEVPRYHCQSRELAHCFRDVPSANASSISNGGSKGVRYPWMGVPVCAVVEDGNQKAQPLVRVVLQKRQPRTSVRARGKAPVAQVLLQAE